MSLCHTGSCTISFLLIVLLKFILLFHIFKVRDANVLSFPSPNIWGRLSFVFGGLFFLYRTSI